MATKNLTEPQRLAKNQAIATSRRATAKRHSAMSPVTRQLKLDASKLTPNQREALERAYLEAKWLTNHLIGQSAWNTWDSKSPTVTVLNKKTGESRTEEFRVLGSQIKQSIPEQVKSNLKTLATLKAKGKKVGALRCKPEVNSLPLKQAGVTYKLRGQKVKIQGIPGWLRFRGSAQLEGLDLSSARLVRRATGYFLLITGFASPEATTKIVPSQPPVGLDMGVRTHITLSDGREVHALVKETDRLRGLQAKLARQDQGSNNHRRTREAIQREYQKMNNRKDELASQFVADLKHHTDVYYQDENLTGWKTRYGKRIHHSILGRVKARLGRLDQATMVDRWAPTTQWCPACGQKTKHDLGERTYRCATLGCGYEAPRDVHAARNMIELGSKASVPGEPGTAPVEEGTALSKPVTTGPARKSQPLKQEAVRQKMAAVGNAGSAGVEAARSLVAQ